MIADSICTKLYKNIQEKLLSGVVHSVFHSAFNVITTDNEFITFLSCNKPMGPNGIRIYDNSSFLECGIEPGMRIDFYKRYIKIDELGITIDLYNSLKWDARPDYSYIKDSLENVILKLDAMRFFLMNSGNRDGILPLLTTLNEKYPDFEILAMKSQILDKSIIFMKERFSDFIEAYLQDDYELISNKAKNVIGYGAGLTPSMDDFLSGLMISRIYLFDYLNKDLNACLEFNKRIIEKIQGKTTRVSEEMLKYSSKGEANEDIRSLMLSLISESKDDFILSIKKVAAFGETSGTDIISGIYIGSKILLKSIGGR